MCMRENYSGCPAKSGPLDFGTKNNFPSFFVSEKGLVHIYKNATYYFPVFLFFPCYEPKLNFGRTEVAERVHKGEIHQCRSQSPRVFWSAPRHGALE